MSSKGYEWPIRNPIPNASGNCRRSANCSPNKMCMRKVLPSGGTGVLMGLFKQYLEIAQSFRVTLRQLRGDLLLSSQQVFQRFASVRIRRLIRRFARAAEKLFAGSGREPIILLAGLNERQSCQIAELR